MSHNKKSIISKMLFALVLILLFSVIIYVVVNLKFDLNKIELLQHDEKQIYKETFDAVLSTVNTSISIMTAGVAIFALFGVFLSIINVYVYKEMQDAISKAEIIKNEFDNMKALQLISIGMIYNDKDKYKYALESFSHAEETYPSPLVKFQIANMYIDLSEKFPPHQEELIDNALVNLEQIISDTETKCDKNLLADSYFTLGCLWGSRGKKEVSQKIDFLERSKSYFSKAIALNKNNPQYYRNLSLTNLYLDEKSEIKKNLNLALRYAKKDELYYLEINEDNLLRIFTEDDKTLMGANFWIELNNQFRVS